MGNQFDCGSTFRLDFTEQLFPFSCSKLLLDLPGMCKQSLVLLFPLLIKTNTVTVLIFPVFLIVNWRYEKNLCSCVGTVFLSAEIPIVSASCFHEYRVLDSS